MDRVIFLSMGKSLLVNVKELNCIFKRDSYDIILVFKSEYEQVVSFNTQEERDKEFDRVSRILF